MTTAHDILEVLRSLGVTPNPEAKTVAELMVEWGHSDNWCRTALRTLSKHGCVEVTKKVVDRLGGGTTTVPAYIVSVPNETVAKGHRNGRNSGTQRRRSNPSGVR